MTGATSPAPDCCSGMSEHKIKEAKKAKLEQKLDEALKESFPSSDPVALSQPGPAEPAPAPAKLAEADRERQAKRRSR